MPRRARRAAAAAASAAASTATTGGGGGGGGCVGRGDAEVATTLAKVLRAVQEQRELRLDAGQARKRGRLLEAELNALKAEHERTRGIKEKLDTLSRELTRQNRTVIEESERVIAEEKRRRDGIVRRFNDAMREVNEKLARQGAAAVMVDDDDDGEVRDELVRAVRDAEERYRCRTEHFESGVRRRALERQLAAARIREANVKREKAAGMLKDVRLKCASAREEHKRLHVAVARFSAAAGDATTALEAVRAQLTRAERKLNAHCRAAKEAQQANARVRNDNVATGIRIKAMHSEEARLQSAMSSVREEERKERGKREALERLHKQVTAERAELRNDVLIMQEAWTNLKADTETLRGTVASGGNRVFEVLQSIMNREYLDVAVADVVPGGSTIEDAIREELSNLKLAADALPPALLELAQAPFGARGAAASSRRRTHH